MSKRPTVTKPPLDFGNETLGQRLARLRKQAGYTQIDFAEKVGITQVLVSAYETDRHLFSAEMAVRFAIVLNVSLDDLLHPSAKKKITKKPSLRVMRRMEQIEKLSPAAQSAVLRTIDAFVRSAER